MKKLIAILLCCALMLSMSITAFAEDISGDHQSGTSAITYHVDSSFIVNIPETIDANTDYTFTASEINVESDLAVNVYCTNLYNGGYITMTNASGDSFNLTFSGMEAENRVAHFDNDNLQSTITIIGQPIEGDVKAGDYTGTAEFEVRLELKNG